ncbi:MAG TPA: hypothetical protein VF843_10720 [Streptosporangiaceae bacterium]
MVRITSRTTGPDAARGELAAVRRPGLAVFTGAIAVSAYGGALGLIAGFLSLGAVVTSRLPFASPVLSGIALMAVVAIPATVVCWLAARGDRRTGDATVLLGVLLVGWIVVELAFIRELSFFHPLFAVIGGLLVWLGLRARPAPRVRD